MSSEKIFYITCVIVTIVALLVKTSYELVEVPKIIGAAMLMWFCYIGITTLILKCITICFEENLPNISLEEKQERRLERHQRINRNTNHWTIGYLMSVVVMFVLPLLAQKSTEPSKPIIPTGFVLFPTIIWGIGALVVIIKELCTKIPTREEILQARWDKYEEFLHLKAYYGGKGL
jgi:hypothetical protein